MSGGPWEIYAYEWMQLYLIYSFAEVVVGTLFIMLILLWFFRSPGFIPGWAGYLDSG